MNYTWDRRYDKKWDDLRTSTVRCHRCMDDAPYEWCCRYHCGEYESCKKCDAKCRVGKNLCVK